MGMKTRFRRWVGISGSVAIVAMLATGSALAIGATAASAVGTSTAFSLDLSTPTTIYQNVQGDQTTPTNAGDGWNFVVEGWTVNEQIVIQVGTPNGGTTQPTLQECNTAYPQGVNSSRHDYSNFVFFSGTDATAGIFSASGSDAATFATPAVVNNSGCSDYAASGSDDPVVDSPAGGNELILTFTNSAASPTTTSEVYLGYSAPAVGAVAPLVFDTGFGAATGAVPFAAAYYPASDYNSATALPSGYGGTSAAPITIPSDATVSGETPSANSPSLGIQRTTGTDLVAPQAISPLVINEPGDFLPPNGTGVYGAQTSLVDEPTRTDPGEVCVVLDNHTYQDLEFANIPSWGVTPGANTNPFTAAAGGLDPVNLGSVDGGSDNVLALPVYGDNPPGAPAIWTASGIQLTSGASIDYADGPVYAYLYYEPGTTSASDCPDATGSQVTGTSGSYHDSWNITLGYVQLTTISELANSIYGYSPDDTAAEAIGHQFDYTHDSCIGNYLGLGLLTGGSIFVASDASYQDALGASYPAGADDSAVALTNPTSLSASTAQIIRLEGVQTVYLVGGDLAISDAVENQLASTQSYFCGGTTPRVNILDQPIDLTVIRIFGQTADDTNLALATFPGAEKPTPGWSFGAFAAPSLFNDTGSGISTAAPSGSVQNIGIVVSDAGFQDAVSASALAYAWPLPLITTTPTALDPDALAALAADHISEVILLGGVDAITDSVVTELGNDGISALRIAGLDGSDTSTQLAAFELAGPGTEQDGFVPGLFPAPLVGLGLDNIDFLWGYYVGRTAGITIPDDQEYVSAHVTLLARGDYYGDAESASVLAVHNGLWNFGGAQYDDASFKPILLAESPTSLGTPVTTFLNNAGLALSGLPGAFPAFGWSGDDGGQENDSSSSVYTIQPIGGTYALTTPVLNAAIAAVTAG